MTITDLLPNTKTDHALDLEVRNLSVSFGGLWANQDISLTIKPGQLHALIGPNGAGKSTLLSLLSGTLKSVKGSITLAGKELTQLNSAQRSQLGIGRSFQHTNVFTALSVLENLQLAAQSRYQKPSILFKKATHIQASLSHAQSCLELVQLQKQAHLPAGSLSHGQKRQLEIGMVIATQAHVFLLDEPLAGMGTEEAAQIIDLISKIGQHHTVLLVEHDMDAVFSVAHTLSVMLEGKLIKTGPPTEIQSCEAVQKAYLGEAAPS